MNDTLHFIGQMARRWRTTGAIAPSGPALARQMVHQVGEVAPGDVILELGPGTGVFTREIAKRHPGTRLVAVEFNELFAKRLAKAMPGVDVVQGCASELDKHLAAAGVAVDRIAAIVSGLPLLSLPGDLPTRVLAAIRGVLPVGRRYVQFTYSERVWRKFAVPGFARLPSRRVWLNVPPAVVMTFERTNDGDSQTS
jgi:phosphatidylethanolamine/phosphatidyl-N-methylethanolamine N-methyltransferase